MNAAQDQDPSADEYVVECFWPGVSIADVDELDRRAREVVRRCARRGIPVRYLGSLLVPGDEVVLFEFQADSPEIAETASRQAGIPFHRIVPAMRRPNEVKP